MNKGEIVLVPFPFSELKNIKVRPAVVICETKDRYKDIVVSAISSVIPLSLNRNEIIVHPDSINKLRTISVIKVDRMVTIRKDIIIAKLGKLDAKTFKIFRESFLSLID